MLKRLLIALTLICACALASAQDFYHRPSPFAGRTMLTLALFDEVRAELKTTPDENTKVDDLVSKMQGEVGDAIQNGGGDFDTIREAIDKINAKYDGDCAKALTDDQNKRLKELFIQYNGASSITNPTISTDLSITDDEKTKIKAALADNSAKTRELFQSGGNPQEMGPQMNKLHDEYNAALDKILTDDQRTKLKTMEGTKFEFKKVTAAGQ